MKRFAVVTIASVMLAVSAGIAFAGRHTESLKTANEALDLLGVKKEDRK